jgi:hypothetical protein
LTVDGREVPGNLVPLVEGTGTVNVDIVLGD